MKVLVTGGAGFIGSHLCERLISMGQQVFCLDNFYPFYAPEIKRNNLSAIISHPAFNLIEGDIRNPEDIERCFAEDNIDIVIHLAAMAGVRPSLENPELYWDVNHQGTLNLLNTCKKSKIKKFILASSSSVYGNHTGGKFKETDDVDNPISPYAATKRSGEMSCFLFQQIMQIPVICLRFFTVYGPRQRPDLAIHKFTKLLYEGKPITIYGDGTTSRDYTYIDDTIDGIFKAIDYKDDSLGYEIFNLGESKTIKLIEMISELEKATDKKAIISRQPMQEGDVIYTCADISKSQRLLGFNPTHSFEQGIRKFIDWYKG